MNDTNNRLLTLQDCRFNLDNYIDDDLKQLPTSYVVQDQVEQDHIEGNVLGFFRCYVTTCASSEPSHEDMVKHATGLKDSRIYSWITKCGYISLPDFQTNEPTVRELFENHINPRYVNSIAYLVTYFYGDRK